MSRSNKLTVLVLMTLCLCLTIESIDGLRILGIFPFQMKSQFVMGEELCKALAAKGHQVDVYSHFPQRNPIPNYNDFSLLGTLPALTNNVTYEEATSISDPAELMSVWFEELNGPLCDMLGLPMFQKLIHNPPMDPPYDVLFVEFAMVHCFLPFGRLLNATIIGVQAMTIYPWQYDAFQNPTNLASEPNFATDHVNPMSFLQRLDNFIIHHRIKRVFKRHIQLQDRYIEKYFGHGYPSAEELAKDISLIFVIEDAALFGPKAHVPKVIPAAGLHVVDHNETLTKEIKKWLDESTSGCVLFTFGSMIRIETLPRHVLDEIYKSFRNIAPVRVLMKIAEPEILPPGLPSNVLTQSWIQQGAVLKHRNTKAFITHGGLMGTLEAIHYNVPLIGIPIFFDQYYTVNTYASKKIAIKLPLPKVTEVTFTNALREILKNPTYRENVKIINEKMKDRPVNLMDTAVFWVEYMCRHGKDALKSASEDMPWWQVSLLDIYVTLITLAVVALYICVKIITIVINRFFHTSDKISIEKLKRQ